MRIVLTGASGFIGGALLRTLRGRGHQCVVLGRRPIAGDREVEWVEWPAMSSEPPSSAFDGADAVVHLAGEPVAQRWNAEAKKRIHDSRADGTRNLVRGLKNASRPPAALINASAIGFYGDRGDEVLTEDSSGGSGFLARVVRDWEAAAGTASEAGLRVVKIRIGVVLGKGGGALASMLPAFRLGAGGKLGTGKQWMSWVHLDDLISLFAFAVENPGVRGVLNGTSPNPVRNDEFTATLGRTLHRPAFLTVPSLVLSLRYGELGAVLLEGQRVLPRAAEAAGFQFSYPQLGPALKAVV